MPLGETTYVKICDSNMVNILQFIWLLKTYFYCIVCTNLLHFAETILSGQVDYNPSGKQDSGVGLSSKQAGMRKQFTEIPLAIEVSIEQVMGSFPTGNAGKVLFSTLCDNRAKVLEFFPSQSTCA